MQPPPLPVDVVSTWWDYFVDGVGVVSGLATAGALIVAAQTYRQQVSSGLRKQATEILLVVSRPAEGENGQTIAKVINESDQPIKLIDYFVFGGDTQIEVRESLPRIIVAHDTSLLALKTGNVYAVFVYFADAGNRLWGLREDGSLKQWSKREWRKRQRIEKRYIQEKKRDHRSDI